MLCGDLDGKEIQKRGYMYAAAATAAKSRQSSLTLCAPIDRSPPGSPIPGIFQARTQEWAALPSPDYVYP